MKTEDSSIAFALLLASTLLLPCSHAFSTTSTTTTSRPITIVSHDVSSRAALLSVSRLPVSRSSSSSKLNAAMVESDDLLLDNVLESTLTKEEEVEKQSTDTSYHTAAATESTTTKNKTYLDDGFVFGLEGSGLDRPKGKVASIVVEGDSLETQPYQRAVVAATFLGHAGFLGVNYMDLLHNNGGDVALTSAQFVLVAFAGWALADLGSGVLHWSVDNYGNGKTPVMGSIIAAFQGHHSAPWTITERGFCNNVYKLCIPFGIVPMAMINALTGPLVSLFFVVFCMVEIMSQEFHKWSHMTKSQCPGWVNALQDVGLTVGRTPHAMHHLAPYEGNYCIISGIWNKPLDQSGIFRWMEHMIYNINGVESNAWKLDADLRERTLRGDYTVPKSHQRRYK